MMPRLADVEVGLKLTVSHAIRDAFVPHAVQAEYLLYAFASMGATGYVKALGLSRGYGENEVEACLEELAGKLGAKRPGGLFDTDAAALHFVKAYQEGKLGKHTLDYLPETLLSK